LTTRTSATSSHTERRRKRSKRCCPLSEAAPTLSLSLSLSTSLHPSSALPPHLFLSLSLFTSLAWSCQRPRIPPPQSPPTNPRKVCPLLLPARLKRLVWSSVRRANLWGGGGWLQGDAACGGLWSACDQRDSQDYLFSDKIILRLKKKGEKKLLSLSLATPPRDSCSAGNVFSGEARSGSGSTGEHWVVLLPVWWRPFETSAGAAPCRAAVFTTGLWERSVILK